MEKQCVLEKSLADLQEEIKIFKAKDLESLDNVYDKLEQRIRRKRNRFISGVAEQLSGTLLERREQEEVKSILDETGADDCKFEKCYRIGQPKSHGIRLCESLDSMRMKNKVLREVKAPRDNEKFRVIDVKPDLTPIQQRVNPNQPMFYLPFRTRSHSLHSHKA